MRAPYLSLFLLALACNGQNLDVGSDTAAGSQSGATAAGGADNTNGSSSQLNGDYPVVDADEANWPVLSDCVNSATLPQSSIVGIWEGHSEDEYFNPIAKYRLELLAASPGGAICGRVKYGEGEPPPLSSDPAGWYPPLDSSYYDMVPSPVRAGHLQMLDGASYTIIKAGLLDNQLVASISDTEHYRGWCGLQQSYEITEGSQNGSYSCLPVLDNEGGWTIENDTCYGVRAGQEVAFSATQCSICGMPLCACDSLHCTARVILSHKITLTFTGDKAVGQIEPTSNALERMTLRLTRVSS
jgi:hypothetical protein